MIMRGNLFRPIQQRTRNLSINRNDFLTRYTLEQNKNDPVHSIFKISHLIRFNSSFITRNVKATASFSTFSSVFQTRNKSTVSTGGSVVSKNEEIRRSKSSMSLSTLGIESCYDDYERNHEELKVFPSIVIDKNGIAPQGTFAEAQAEFLNPDNDTVKTLSQKLSEANMGVVAHYYMDVELQSVLQQISTQQQRSSESVTASSSQVPNIAIADSLKMGEHAVQMVKENRVSSIACLGVDFMAESVSAILHKNGYGHVPVYRLTPKAIGCSLAASAETDSYNAWLHKAVRSCKENNTPALHVIYINTSLETKAISSSIIPTITCTSSNVIKTLLQASAQVSNQDQKTKDLQIFFGPDTYMGENLISFFDHILKHPQIWTNDRIATDLHPLHNIQTLSKLRDNINVYPQGNCVVHHMFGGEVVDYVKEYYQDSFVTAHLEVPGEMFQIAMNKTTEGKGVVGSTSDILNFITAKVQEEHSKPCTSNDTNQTRRLQFVLGTEAGMVTSIIRSVQSIVSSSSSNSNNKNIEAEIIFPVASEAFTPVYSDDDLVVVPGVSASEGCSTAGGCATCPFMKMNDLNALEDVIDFVIRKDQTRLAKHLPPNKLRSCAKKLNIDSEEQVMDLAVDSIMNMRHFMTHSSLSEDLMKRVKSTTATK